MKNLDIIIPTFKSYKLAELLIRSFEKFKPDTLDIKYIVVENSSDSSYKTKILSLNSNIKWIQNEKATSILVGGNGSDANASGIEAGLELVTTEYVFICHCDTFVSSESFFKEIFKKAEEGHELIGTSTDPSRIKAIHQSGFLAKTSLAKSVSYYPVRVEGSMTHDVGDLLTQKCRDSSISYTCFRNTFNAPGLVEENLSSPFKDFHVDRCLDSSGNVMFMHLGRGIEKQFGRYSKPNRVYFPQWVEFCEGIIG
tara:strand:- start:15958 stop:16719 length:762 start_codon:yes stop_codon:yes gene_type:complete